LSEHEAGCSRSTQSAAAGLGVQGRRQHRDRAGRVEQPVFAGSFDRHVYAVDASTGTLVWKMTP
jgi:outer membrane protein assembly factor BamB